METNGKAPRDKTRLVTSFEAKATHAVFKGCGGRCCKAWNPSFEVRLRLTCNDRSGGSILWAGPPFVSPPWLSPWLLPHVPDLVSLQPVSASSELSAHMAASVLFLKQRCDLYSLSSSIFHLLREKTTFLNMIDETLYKLASTALASCFITCTHSQVTPQNYLPFSQMCFFLSFISPFASAIPSARNAYPFPLYLH